MNFSLFLICFSLTAFARTEDILLDKLGHSDKAQQTGEFFFEDAERPESLVETEIATGALRYQHVEDESPGPPIAGKLDANWNVGRDNPDLTPQQPAGQIVLDEGFSSTGGGPSGVWEWWAGQMKIADDDYYDDHDLQMYWGVSATAGIPDNMEPMAHIHGSAPAGAGMQKLFAVPNASRGRVQVNTPDLQAYKNLERESWYISPERVRHPGRRIAAAFEVINAKWPGKISWAGKGIALDGGSLGGGGALFQMMTLPEPWGSQVNFVTASIGGLMPRLRVGKPGRWPIDQGIGNDSDWDAVDFDYQSTRNNIIRGAHFRHRFSSNDPFFNDQADGSSSQMPWVNVCEREKLACFASWVSHGHSAGEPGVAPMVTMWPYQQDPNWYVSLDKAHPAFVSSTGNYPLTASDRLDITVYPRGHYNLGLTVHHIDSVDTSEEIIFPIKYTANKSIGGDIPDQPDTITVDVVPRRPRNFAKLVHGATLNWEFNGDSGTATVVGDTLTITGLSFTTGEGYKNLRIY